MASKKIMPIAHQYKENTMRTYTVKDGDTLWGIAKEQLHSAARYTEIVHLNGLKTATLRIGQVLQLPRR